MRKLGWAVAASVIWMAPLLGGTADRPFTLLCASLGAVACGLSLGKKPLRGSWFWVWLLVALVATLLQAVPLPPGLRAFLAPGSDADLRQITASLGGGRGGGSWLPLTLDIGGTLHEAVRLAGALSLLVAIGQFLEVGDDAALSNRRRQLVLQTIYGAATLCAACGLLAGLGMTLPWPIAVPAGGLTRALFPAGLLNSNHQAALCGLGALLSLSAAMAATTTARRWALFFACALCNLVLVGTLSRAGVMVWLFFELIQGIRELLRRTGSSEPGLARRLWPLLAVPIALFSGLLLWEGLFSALQQRFLASASSTQATPGSKLLAWREAWPLLRGHWLFGVGRGAFESAFQHVQSQSGRLRFVYLENEWLQAVLDWGVLPALGLFALLFLGLRDAWRKLRSDSAPQFTDAALLGLVALGVHNLFDFNLEVGGVALPAIGLLALCQRPRFLLPRAAVSTIAIFALLGSALLVVEFASQDEDGARLRELCANPAVSAAQVIAVGEKLARRHPFDSYLPALVAARLQSENHRDTVRWVNRALAANPRDLLGRQVGAELLIAAGHRTQGFELLRQAISDADGDDRRRLLRHLGAWATTVDELVTTLPEPALWHELLEQLSAATPPRWPLIRALATRGLALHVQDAALWLGRAALFERDAQGAALAARSLLVGPVPGLLFADLVDLLRAAGQVDDAERLARQAIAQGERPEILLALAQLVESRGNPDSARPLLDRALTLTTDSALLARIHEVYGDLEARAQNPHQALAHRTAAASLRSH